MANVHKNSVWLAMRRVSEEKNWTVAETIATITYEAAGHTDTALVPDEQLHAAAVRIRQGQEQYG